MWLPDLGVCLTCWYVGQLPELLVVGGRPADETVIKVTLVEVQLLTGRLTGSVEWQIWTVGETRQLNIRAEGRFADHFQDSLRISHKWPHVIVVVLWTPPLFVCPWILSFLDIKKTSESCGCEDNSALVPVRDQLGYEGWQVDPHCCLWTSWQLAADWWMFTSRRTKLTRPRPWRLAVNSGHLGTLGTFSKQITFDQGLRELST